MSQIEALARLARLRAEGRLSHTKYEASRQRVLHKDRASSGPRRAIITVTVVVAIIAAGALAWLLLVPREERIPIAAPARGVAPPAATRQVPRQREQATEASQLVDLDRAIVFSNPQQCQPSPTLQRTLDRMLHFDAATNRAPTGGPVTLAGLARPINPVLRTSSSTEEGMLITDYRSSLAMPEGARWHGLRVSRIVVSYVDVVDSDDSQTTAINFLETPATVHRVLIRQGFGAPLAPRFRELEDGACGGSMQIVAIPGGAALQCSFGC